MFWSSLYPHTYPTLFRFVLLFFPNLSIPHSTGSLVPLPALARTSLAQHYTASQLINSRYGVGSGINGHGFSSLPLASGWRPVQRLVQPASSQASAALHHAHLSHSPCAWRRTETDLSLTEASCTRVWHYHILPEYLPEVWICSSFLKATHFMWGTASEQPKWRVMCSIKKKNPHTQREYCTGSFYRNHRSLRLHMN